MESIKRAKIARATDAFGKSDFTTVDICSGTGRELDFWQQLKRSHDEKNVECSLLAALIQRRPSASVNVGEGADLPGGELIYSTNLSHGCSGNTLHHFKAGRESCPFTKGEQCPVFKKSKVLSPGSISLDGAKQLGHGNFGAAYIVELCADPAQGDDGDALLEADMARLGLTCLDGRYRAAVKTLSSSAPQNSKFSFDREIAIHSSICHPHVVRMLFSSTLPSTSLGKEPARALGLECYRDGDLMKLLRAGRLTWPEVTRILIDVADAMAYISSQNLVHRDLAARNVFIGYGRALVGDFGLAVDLDSDTTADQWNEPLPLRWSAPEVLLERKCSTASDVWSYGMLVYEAFTAAALPYLGLTNEKVTIAIRSKLILPPPPGMPVSIASAMYGCWRPKPEDRLDFEELLSRLIVAGKAADYPATSPPTYSEVTALGPNAAVSKPSDDEMYEYQFFRGPQVQVSDNGYTLFGDPKPGVSSIPNDYAVPDGMGILSQYRETTPRPKLVSTNAGMVFLNEGANETESQTDTELSGEGGKVKAMPAPHDAPPYVNVDLMAL